MKNSSYFSSTRIASIALFAALSGVLYVFGFPIAANSAIDAMRVELK